MNGEKLIQTEHCLLFTNLTDWGLHVPLFLGTEFRLGSLADAIKYYRLEGELTVPYYPESNESQDIDTSSGIIYPMDGPGRFKVIPSIDYLTGGEIIPHTDGLVGKIKAWSRVICIENYDTIPAMEFKTEDSSFNKPLTEKQVLAHQAWLEAIGGNSELLERLTPKVFKWIYDEYKTKRGMGFYIRPPCGTQNYAEYRCLSLTSSRTSHIGDCYDIHRTRLGGLGDHGGNLFYVNVGK